jgi:hypothetical protein
MDFFISLAGFYFIIFDLAMLNFTMMVAVHANSCKKRSYGKKSFMLGRLYNFIRSFSAGNPGLPGSGHLLTLRRQAGDHRVHEKGAGEVAIYI